MFIRKLTIMGNASRYQRDHWDRELLKVYGIRYCKACSYLPEQQTKEFQANGIIIIDKINNDGNHNITENSVSDFQYLCRSCNTAKNPRGSTAKAKRRRGKMSEALRKNKNAELPMMEELMDMIYKGVKVELEVWIRNAAYDYDVTPETIRENYLEKWIYSENGPFMISTGGFEHRQNYIELKPDHTHRPLGSKIPKDQD